MSLRDLKPRTTVLARTSSNLTYRLGAIRELTAEVGSWQLKAGDGSGARKPRNVHC
jgi:hypothetical protein